MTYVSWRNTLGRRVYLRSDPGFVTLSACRWSVPAAQFFPATLRSREVAGFSLCPLGVAMEFLTKEPDGIEWVRSATPNYWYRCPDLATIDAELSALLANFLGPNSNVSEARKAQAREDLDTLLDRRSYLELIAA